MRFMDILPAHRESGATWQPVSPLAGLS